MVPLERDYILVPTTMCPVWWRQLRGWRDAHFVIHRLVLVAEDGVLLLRVRVRRCDVCCAPAGLQDRGHELRVVKLAGGRVDLGGFGDLCVAGWAECGGAGFDGL
jgi:hypothetical protein